MKTGKGFSIGRELYVLGSGLRCRKGREYGALELNNVRGNVELWLLPKNLHILWIA